MTIDAELLHVVNPFALVVRGYRQAQANQFFEPLEQPGVLPLFENPNEIAVGRINPVTSSGDFDGISQAELHSIRLESYFPILNADGRNGIPRTA